MARPGARPQWQLVPGRRRAVGGGCDRGGTPILLPGRQRMPSVRRRKFSRELTYSRATPIISSAITTYYLLGTSLILLTGRAFERFGAALLRHRLAGRVPAAVAVSGLAVRR